MMKDVTKITLTVIFIIAGSWIQDRNACTTSMDCYEENESIEPDLYLPPECKSNEGILIVDGPNDTEVCSGETAHFNCRYIGFNAFPEWLINNSRYNTLTLPNNFAYDGYSHELSISHVTLSQNDITIQCFFQIYAEDIPLCLITSSIGSLTVLNSSSVCACKAHDAICPCLQDKVAIDVKVNNTKGKIELEIYCETSSLDLPINVEIRIINEADDSHNKKFIGCGSEQSPNDPLSVIFDEVECDKEYNVSVYIISESDVVLQNPCPSNKTLSNITLPCVTTKVSDWLQALIGFLVTMATFLLIAVFTVVIVYCIRKQYKAQKLSLLPHRDLKKKPQ